MAGYYKGIWETVVMRAADIFMSFPSMILVLVLVSVIGLGVDCYLGYRRTGVDGLCQIDLRQCAVYPGEGIRGIG